MHPKHPDVLTAYGQLLEEGYDDVVEVQNCPPPPPSFRPLDVRRDHSPFFLRQAEHLYSAALIVSPLHERATERRRRTLPLVEKIDQRNFDRVSQKMKRLGQIPRHNPGLKRAKIEGGEVGILSYKPNYSRALP